MDFGQVYVMNAIIVIFLEGVNFDRILCLCVHLEWEGWKMLKKPANSRLIQLFIINIDIPASEQVVEVLFLQRNLVIRGNAYVRKNGI